MIDLAPKNAYSFELATPLVARQLGFAQRGAAHGLGALITRTTTPRARRARPLPTLIETPAGLLYTGLEHNPGLRVLRERFAPVWAAWELPVIVSVAADSAEELAEAVAELDMLEGVRGLELPLALNGALTPELAARLVAAVRAATPLPLIVKLPGHASDLLALARAVADAGADALSLIDGLPAAVPGAGGLSEGLLCGPALRPLALRAVAAVRAAVGLPLLGGGGVLDASDARALLDAGATAVALGSALLNDLRAAARIVAVL